MDKCTIKFNGMTFNSESALEHYLLSKELGVRFQPKNTQAEVLKMLTDSNNRLNEEYLVKEHQYFFNKRLLDSVTNMTKKLVSIGNILNTPKGEASRLIGNRYHEIGELIIKGLNAKIPLDRLLAENKKLFSSEEFIKWGKSVSSMYNRWTIGPDGKPNGNIVMSEFKLANLRVGVGGTVDIAVIHPNGSVTLYDFKGSRFVYGDYNSKIQSNAAQLLQYKEMLEQGEPELGLKPIVVNDIVVIPIHSDIDSDPNGEFNGAAKDAKPENFTLTSWKFEGDQSELSVLNHSPESVFAKTKHIASAVHAMYSPTPGTKTASVTLSGSTAFTKIPIILSGHDAVYGFDAALTAQYKADPRNVTKDKNGVYRWLHPKTGVTVPFQGPEARRDDTSVGNQARYKEIYEEMQKLNSTKDNSLAEVLVSSFNAKGEQPYDAFPESRDKLKQERLNNIFKTIDRALDHIVPASSMEGFENADKDILLVFRNFDPYTGKYSHVDMMSIDELDYDPNQKESPLSSTIFGKHINNSRLESLSHSLKLSGMSFYENTRHANKAVVMGLIAMKLHKENPDLKIGTIYTHSLNNNTALAASFHSLDGIFKHLELTKHIKDSNGNFLIESLPLEIQELINDPAMYKTEDYAFNDVENLLQFIVGHLSQKNRKSTHPGLKTWFDANIQQLLPDGTNEESLRNMAEGLKSDNQKYNDLISALNDRMKTIIRTLPTTKDARSLLKHDREYQLLSNAIIYLSGMVASVDGLIEISGFEKMLATGSMLGVKLVDDFVNRVKRAHGLLERDLLNNYMREKLTVFEKFFGDDSITKKASNRLIGDTTKYFEDMMEVEMFESPDGPIERKTMRFWAEDSSEYNALNDQQKEFITWFNDTVDENMIKNLPKNVPASDIRKYWVRGHIPLLKASNANIAYNSFRRQRLGQKGGYSSFASSWWNRQVSRFSNENTEGTYMEKNMSVEDVQSFFEDQVSHEVGDDIKHGSSDRKIKIGINPDGSPRLGMDDHWETNLERVLDYLVIGTKSKQYLEPLIPLHAAVMQVVNMAELHEQQFTNIKEYLEKYGMATLNRVKMKTFESNPQLEASMNMLVGFAAGMAISFNIFSGTKNFISGHLITLANAVAKASAGDGKSAINLVKSFHKVWTQIINGKTGDQLKMHHIMYNLGLADTDIEALLRDQKFKQGGQYLGSRRMGGLLLHAGNYYHRCVIIISQMLDDGTWDAFEFNEETGKWSYNEDLDPRFDGKEGKMLKNYVKGVLSKESGVGPDGKLLAPYMQMELNRMKKIITATFEPDQVFDNPQLKYTVFGRALLSLGSWAVAKRERYYKTGNTNEILGKLVPVKDENGETIDFKWEGHFVEGIWQTFHGIYRAVRSDIVAEDKGAIKEYFHEMPQVKKENMARFGYDVIFASLLIALVKNLFDDEDEGTFGYQLAMGAMSEIYFLEHLLSMKKMVAEPFPALGIYTTFLNNVTSGDVERTTRGITQVLGPLKSIYQLDRAIKGPDGKI